MSDQEHGGPDGASGSAVPHGVPPGPGYGVPAPAVAPVTAPVAAPGWYTTPAGTTAWWDGSQWLSAPTPPITAFYRPVDGIGAAAQALLVVSAVAAGFVAVAEALRYRTIASFLDGPATVSSAELTSADTLVGVAGALRLVVLVPTGIVFLVWLHRVFTNLDGPLRAGRLDHTAGWAVGWWFVPLANLVKPPQVIREAWKASEPGTADVPASAIHWPHRKAPKLIGWWWACWILGGVVLRIFAGFSNGALDAQAIQRTVMWNGISALVLVVCAVLAVLIVRGISDRQARRAASIGARQLA